MLKLTAWSQSLLDTIGITPHMQGKVLSSLIAILILWFFRKVVLKIALKQFTNSRTQYRWRKTTAYIVFLLGILVVGRVWYEGLQSVSTFLGLMTAGIAIALKDPLTNLAGWAYIFWQRPFEVGDRVQIGETIGDVIDQRLFQFTLLELGNWISAEQRTGRMMFVPNTMVFTHPLANYTKEFKHIWNELSVDVTFESDWQKAKKTLAKIAKDHSGHLSERAQQDLRRASRRFVIFTSETSFVSTVYTTIVEHGVRFFIRYPCDPGKRRESAEQIWEDVLTEFGKCNDIDFAYPTTRYYNNVKEGKEEARAEA